MNFGGVIHLNKIGVCIFCGVCVLLFLYSVSDGKTSHIETKTVNLRKLLKAGILAAEYGGKKVVETKDNMNVKSKGLTKEGLQDSVTMADYLSNCAITQVIKSFCNDLNIISEEENQLCPKLDAVETSFNDIPDKEGEKVSIDDVTVWIDPLDATHEYTEKSPSLYKYITTMVCIAVRGKPVIGIIHKPFNKTTSWAWVGKDLSDDLRYKNRLVNSNMDNEEVKIIISRSHQGQIEDLLRKKFKEKFKLVVAAGAGYKALEVAYGNVDAYMHSTAIKKWDICAGNAIINAKRGHMTTKFNKILDYSSSENVLNEDGLIVTLDNHEKFIGKL